MKIKRKEKTRNVITNFLIIYFPVKFLLRFNSGAFKREKKYIYARPVNCFYYFV